MKHRTHVRLIPKHNRKRQLNWVMIIIGIIACEFILLFSWLVSGSLFSDMNISREFPSGNSSSQMPCACLLLFLLFGTATPTLWRSRPFKSGYIQYTKMCRPHKVRFNWNERCRLCSGRDATRWSRHTKGLPLHWPMHWMNERAATNFANTCYYYYSEKYYFLIYRFYDVLFKDTQLYLLCIKTDNKNGIQLLLSTNICISEKNDKNIFKNIK